MTLRTRLLIAVGGLLAVALVATGILVVGVTRQNLVDQLDGDLRGGQPVADIVAWARARGEDEPTGRRFALMVFDHDGDQIGRTSIRAAAYRPTPCRSCPRRALTSLPIGQIVELPAERRVAAISRAGAARPARAGTTSIAVLAAPMAGVEASVAVLIRALAVVGLMRAGGRARGRLVPHSARPAAAREQSPRLPSASPPATCRSGSACPSRRARWAGWAHAFDSMLDQIQAAFDSQQRALEAKERSERSCASSSPTPRTSCARR